MARMIMKNILYPKSRQEWREWLNANYATATEIWVAIPKKDKPLDYNDLVEEALCFNWIDSTLKTLDGNHTAQRITPRKTKGNFSQLNIERIKLLLEQNQIHPQFVSLLEPVAKAPFLFADDILDVIKQNDKAWTNFQAFSEPYKRVRIASIELARGNQSLFEKRLSAFFDSCVKNKVKAGSWMQKYY